ncbi:MAG: hypothetical protein AB1503_08950 [Bacillota bacterium]|nr:hypothetical protein [Bacillota bacterium]
MISRAMIRVAEEEGLSPEQVRGAVAAGTTVILANPNHRILRGPLRPPGAGVVPGAGGYGTAMSCRAMGVRPTPSRFMRGW